MRGNHPSKNQVPAHNPASEPTSEASQSKLVRAAVLIGAAVFASTFPQPANLRLPFQYLLKTELHVSRETMAAFFALSTIAWYFKPIAGILSDSVPLFGTRRRHYLMLSSIAAALLWLVIWLVPRTYSSLMLSSIGMNAMLVIGSTVAGALMVEFGQRYGATGRLTSARYFVFSACVLLSGPIGGFLAARPFRLTALTGAISALSAAPFAFWLLKEPRVARVSGAAWTSSREQFRTLMRSRTLWIAAGFIFFLYIAPGFGTPLYYFQTDTLKLSQQFIGTLILLAGAFSLVGSFAYGLLCSRVTLRTLLFLSIAASAVGTLGYLFYHSGAAAAIVESENGFVGALAELALMDLAVRATPRGSEGLGFALMISVRNASVSASDIFGSYLIDHHYATFFNLVWLNAATTALVLLAIPLLPHAIIARRDATPVPGAPAANSGKELTAR